MNGRRDIAEVRILRRELNTTNQSNQYVTVAKVSREVGDLFDEFKNGEKNLEEARQELARLSASSAVHVPVSIYVNVYNSHASVYLIQKDRLKETNADVVGSRQLARMNKGLRVFFSPDSFEVINPVRGHRIDLYTTDGQEYKIGMTEDVLYPKVYNMFKCYEVIGISNYDVEWAYLMAAQDWYDMGTNNCLTYSKRIIREIHRQVMDADIDASELNELYISTPGEHILETTRFPILSFLAPRWQSLMMVLGCIVFIFSFVEIRLQYFCQQ